MRAETLDAAVSRDSAQSWWRAVLVLAMASVSFGAVTAVPILMKPLMAEWGTGAANIAGVHMVTLIGGGLGSLLFGRLLDRVGFFPLVLVAALATSGGLFVVSQAQSLWVVYLACGLLIGAIGQGVFFSPMMVALSRWFTRHSALAMAVASSGQSLGGFLVPPLLRQGVEWMGWRASLAWYALLALMLLLPAAWAFRRSPPVPLHSNRSSGEAQEVPRRRYRFWMYGLAFAVFNAVTFAVVGHLLAFGEERGFLPVVAASLTSALLGSTLFFRLAAGLWMKRWGAYRVLLVSSSLHVVGVLGMVFAESFASMAWSAAAIGLGFGGYLPAYAVLVVNMFPARESGRRVAEINFFGFIAAGVGSGGAGWLRDFTGSYFSTFQWCAVLAGGGLALLFALRRSLDDRQSAGATAWV